MVNAQEWLNKNYPLKNRKDITELNFNSHKLREKGLIGKEEYLEGFLSLEGFVRLEEFICSQNQLRKLNVQDCSDLKTLYCCDNLLTDLNLSQNSKLEVLSISDNNFSEQDLTFLSHLVGLKHLSLENRNKEKIQRGIYNRFVGSLESLKNMTKLKHLNISDTDIDSGLEYLPDSVEHFWFSVEKREDARVNSIYNLFTKEELELEEDLLYDNIGGKSLWGWVFPASFFQKIHTIKNQAKNRARNLLAEELAENLRLSQQLQTENFSLKEKNAKLEEELIMEREEVEKALQKAQEWRERQLKEKNQEIEILQKKVNQLQSQLVNLQIHEQQIEAKVLYSPSPEKK